MRVCTSHILLLLLLCVGKQGAFAQTSPVPQPAVGANAPPIGATSPAAPANEGEKKPDETTAIVAPPPKFRSFFFSDQELDAIGKVKAMYGRQGLGDDAIYDEEDLLDQLNGIKINEEDKIVEQPVVEEKYYTQFYLESLVYHAPNDWVVWLKEDGVGKKLLPLSAADAQASLRIIGTQKEYVVFEWKPVNWMRVAEAYKDENPDIIIDDKRRLVVFTLRTNQTLTSQDMQIKEGPVPLVEIKVEASGAVGAGDGTQNLLPDIFSDGTKQSNGADNKSDEGMSGLLNRGNHILDPSKRP